MSDIFSRMVDGAIAQHEAQMRIAEILGVEELLGISFDDYDASFEIFPLEEDAGLQAVTPEQDKQILALGCLRYWINFPDGTEIYCTSPRKQAVHNRWDAYNKGILQKRRAAARRVSGGTIPCLGKNIPRRWRLVASAPI